jgi:hypothetical protein
MSVSGTSQSKTMLIRFVNAVGSVGLEPRHGDDVTIA